MKSFRFYLTDRPNPVSKFVDEYSDSELAGFIAEFDEDLRRRRKLAGPVALCLAAWAAGFVLSLAFGDILLFIAVHGFSVLVFALFIGVLGPPKCPACKNKINLCIGDYCPECGSAELNRNQWLYIQCTSCDRNLERWQKQTYKTSFCSHCGIPLNGNTGTPTFPHVTEFGQPPDFES